MRCWIVLLAACSSFGHEGGTIDRWIGRPCSSDSDCENTCLLESQFPGGFCTRRCNSDDDCTGDTVCAAVDGGSCLFECPAFDCERLIGGYTCREQSHVVGPQKVDGTILACIGPLTP